MQPQRLLASQIQHGSKHRLSFGLIPAFAREASNRKAASVSTRRFFLLLVNLQCHDCSRASTPTNHWGVADFLEMRIPLFGYTMFIYPQYKQNPLAIDHLHNYDSTSGFLSAPFTSRLADPPSLVAPGASCPGWYWIRRNSLSGDLTLNLPLFNFRKFSEDLKRPGTKWNTGTRTRNLDLKQMLKLVFNDAEMRLINKNMIVYWPFTPSLLAITVDFQPITGAPCRSYMCKQRCNLWKLWSIAWFIRGHPIQVSTLNLLITMHKPLVYYGITPQNGDLLTWLVNRFFLLFLSCSSCLSWRRV